MMRGLNMSARQRLGLGGAALLALGAVGGAGAVSLTRPSVEMAPTVATPVARLSGTQGLVTVRGRVAEVYGDRFVVQDGTGRALVAIGRDEGAGISRGSPILVQGRFDDGQLRARFLVDGSGQAREVGPGGHRHGGRHAPPPGRDGPPPPPPPSGAPAGPNVAPPAPAAEPAPPGR